MMGEVYDTENYDVKMHIVIANMKLGGAWLRKKVICILIEVFGKVKKIRP